MTIYKDSVDCPTCLKEMDAVSPKVGGRVGWFCDSCLTLYPDKPSNISSGEPMTDVKE